jgi:hypothetical protein
MWLHLVPPPWLMVVPVALVAIKLFHDKQEQQHVHCIDRNTGNDNSEQASDEQPPDDGAGGREAAPRRSTLRSMLLS